MVRVDKRQEYILTCIKETGFASITEIAKRFDVSIETIRRDINELCKNNMVKKVRGGAVSSKPSVRKDEEYLLRMRSNQQQKLSIGLKAASFIHDGSVVAFDCGVSIQAVASCLSNVKNVTLVTNSISVASILLDKINRDEISGRIILIGGELDNKNRFSKGAIPTNAIADFYFDIAFISCTAVSCDAVSSYNLDECSFSKRLIERSSASILIAESNKIDKSSVCSFAKITDFVKVITDDKNLISDNLKKHCENNKVELIVVPI